MEGSHRPTNPFRIARLLEKSQREAERRLAREMATKCDWDDPDDVSVYRSATRLHERQGLLDLIVPTRICPECEHLMLSSRSWVINKKRTAAVCRSCFFRAFGVKGRESNMDVTIFPSFEKSFLLDKNALRRSRLGTGMSIREFARRAGWSRSYQERLELKDGIKTVSEATASTILTVLRESGLTTRDVTGE